MNPLSHMRSLLTEAPWAMNPDQLSFLAQLDQLQRRLGAPLAEDEFGSFEARRPGATHGRTPAASDIVGGVAVLPMVGIVSQRGWFCGVSTEQFGNALDAALADSAVKQVLIDVDSPGGAVYGVQELAARIYKARSVKPIVACINSCASSAAYWLASQASRLYITPGGEAGGIGVWTLHQDLSGALKMQGITTTLISAGKHKVEGNPYGPLPDESKAFMQSRVADYYAAFSRDVARGRGVTVADVRTGMGQGRTLGSAAALKARMVDAIKPFDEVLRDMSARSSTPNMSARSSTPNLNWALIELRLLH